MTDLEKRAEGYCCYNFPTTHTENMVKACVEFAQQETKLLSKHILELQTTNGALTDRVNELEEYLTIDCNNNDRFFDCLHGYIYAIPEHNVYLHKCNVQEECYCIGCNNFIPKIVRKESK